MPIGRRSCSWAGSGMGACCCASARGDGGTLRLRERKGAYDIAVFTAPTPLRAGPIDISVLVQDAATGEMVPDARLTVTVAPRGRPGETIRRAATIEAATNKLLRAALLELPQPGWWDVEVAIKSGKAEEQVRFSLQAANRSPRWVALWPWLGWPALAIALFCLHQYLILRRSSGSCAIINHATAGDAEMSRRLRDEDRGSDLGRR